MTNNEIIEMACQAFGGVIKKEERDNFIAFAKLVAEKEREACAKIADSWNTNVFWENKMLSINIAKEIRSRGQE